MSKTTNRVLSMVLTVLMLLSMLTVFAVADAAPFAEAYDGTVIPKTALLVDVTITEEADATVTRAWDGKEYTFVVGTNAFKSLTEAYAYAAGNQIARPAIIITGWTEGENLTIETASDVYAPNWNTAPMNEMTDAFDAVASNGADWTENTTYTANQIKIGSLKATADVVGSAAVYGFTVTSQIDVASARTTESEAVDFLVKNTILDASASAVSNVLNINKNTSAEATDTLTLKNFWLKKVGNINRARVFGDGAFSWPNIVFDGMYADLSTMGICDLGGGSNDHIKSSSLTSSVVFKNSNLRNTDATSGKYWQLDRTGATGVTNSNYTRTVIYDNNVMYNFNNIGFVVYNNWNTLASSNMIGYYGYPNVIEVTDNFVYNPTAIKLTNGTDKVYANEPELINFTITGNTILGATAQTYSAATVADNYWVAEAKASVDEYAAVAGAQYASQGTYYLDYAKTLSSVGITVTGVEVQGTATVDNDKIEILIDGASTEKLTTASFTTGETDKTVTKTLSNADGVVIEEYDLSTLAGVESLSLKVAYDDTYYRTYSISIIDTKVESFNTQLADGITVGEVEFTVDDTAVYLPTGVKTYVIGEETATYLKFAGTTYKFVIDNENVFANNGTDMSALEGFTNVILPAGYYGDLTLLTEPANYYGSYMGVDPIDKSGASADNNYDWALNADWDFNNDSDIRRLNIPATAYGKIVIDGITISKDINDSLRTADVDSADITYTNIVHNAAASDTTAVVYMHSARSQTGGDYNEDKATFKNYFVNNFTSNQFFHEWNVPNLTLDNFYWNTAISGQKRNLLAMFKFASATPNKTLTIKNSNLRSSDRGDKFNAVRIDQGNGVNLVFEDNIFYTAAGCGALQFAGEAYAVADVAINRNLFIANGAATLFGSGYINSAATLSADDNTFVGYGSAAVSIGGIPLTNTFVSSDLAAMKSTAATGIYVADMGSNDYYLDYAKTVKASELVLASAAAGTSDATVGTVAEETKSLIITLGASKTTEGMVMTVGEAATGKWLDADKAEVAAATAAGTYYYRVTSTKTPTVYVDYTVTVLGAPAQPFASSYNVDGEGEIQGSALLVDTSITETTGTVIERKWDGEFYKFTVGTNAFASLDAAYAYINDADIKDPQIIVTNYSGQLIVKQIANIYAPNWNTVPMLEMGDMTKVGAKANGVDWTANDAYTENELEVSDIIFAGGFVCDEDQFVKVAGFTVTGFISTDAYGLSGELARTAGETINVELVNFRANTAKFLFDHHYTAASGAGGEQYLAENDSLIVRNLKYDMCGARFWNGDGAVPSYLEIDGLYVDFSKLPLTANTFMKKSGAHGKTIVKNSNLRGNTPGVMGLIAWAGWSAASYHYDEDYGYSHEMVVDNNTMTYGCYFNGGKAVDGTPIYDYRQLYFEGSRMTGCTITNNYMDRQGNTFGRIYASNYPIGSKLGDVSADFADTVVTTVFAGNKVVGYNMANDAFGDGPVNAYDNYFASEIKADGNYENVAGTAPVNAQYGLAGDCTYYLDYAMTVKSDVIYDGYAVTDIGRNMIISKAATADEEGEILYAYDDKVVNNEGTITVNLAHIIDGVNALNKATIYTADAEADVETGTLTLTADANNQATLKLSVWSHDKTKAITWNITLTEPTHNWGDWTKVSDATCQALAVEKRECEGDCMVADTCTAYETREVGELAAHVFENYQVSDTASCLDSGKLTSKCTNCDATNTIDNPEDPVKAHAGKKVDAVAATCTVDGVKEYYTCENGCAKAYADAEFKTVIEDLDAWKKGDGKIAAAHKLEKVDAVAATCTVDGVKEHFKCTVCAKFFADDKAATEIADIEAWKKADGKVAAGHVWGEYVYNNDATEEADGTKTAKCANCDATDTVTAEGTKLEPAVEIKDTSKVFNDVKAKKWYTEAIDYCYSYGFIAGTSADTFGLNTNVTRGMFITILARIAGVDTTTKGVNNVETKFSDVKSGKYYTAAIKWANDNAIVSGTSDTTFGPDNAISRQDLCVMVVNYAKFMGFELTAAEDEVTFTDASSIRNYAKAAVKTCQMADIVNGYTDGSFGPTKTATRAEAAVILYKLHSGFMK